MKGLKITSTTWARDSHDLFDYEARHANTRTFHATAPSLKVVRANTEVQVISEQDPVQPQQGTDHLLRIVQKDGAYTLLPAEKTACGSSPKRLWMVVRDLASRGHVLLEGDIIKLGRFKLRVRQCVAHQNEDSQAELRLDENEVLHIDDHGEETLEQTPCRICLLEGPSEDDPLITPCACKGSIRFVHLGCLRTWIKGRLNLPENSKGSYFYKQLQCELCKTSYPSMLYSSIQEKKYPLVPIPTTQSPFIVLENMVRDSQQHSNRGLHVISLAENKLLKLGRGHESDVRIADVSISRCHATIRFHNRNGGQFILEDHCSKFGTLVAIKKPKVIDVASPLSVQVGRSVLSFRVDGDSPTEQGSPRNRRSLSATFSAFTGAGTKSQADM